MATIVNKNTPLIHKKEFQMMNPAPLASGAGMFMIAPDSGNFDIAMYVTSAVLQYLYMHTEDGFVAIPSGALAGTFGTGSCGVYHPWSIPYTANGGSTTTVTVAAATYNISGVAIGSIIEFISAGTASGYRRTVTNIITDAGGNNITLFLDSAVNTAILTSHTFRLTTGRFFIMNAGTIAAGIFKVFDVATLSWQASLGTTNLPATWGTDGKLVLAYNYGEIMESSIATAGASNTLTNGVKNWGVNQWTNYQIRISGGTGIGQVRTIASNTSTALTLSAVWTTIPDATSTYEITANEDYLYLLGNNAVTMYRYSISGNTWTVMAPTTARAAAPVAGMTANAFGTTGDTGWADTTNIKDGRYIFSLRGGAVGTMDRFDIAGGTAGAGAWTNVVYVAGETFTTGTSAFNMGRHLYIKKDATHRFFKFDVCGNYLEPLAVNLYPDGTAVLGNKLWIKNYDTTRNIMWLYSLGNTLTVLHRLLIF